MFKHVFRPLLTFIREYFSHKEHRVLWIPTQRRWVHKTECVWESAPGFTTEIVLADEYSQLQSLFYFKLKVPSATIGKVVEELRQNSDIKALDLNRRKSLIFTLNHFLRKSPSDWQKLHPLKDVPVMPISNDRYSNDVVSLGSLNRSFWYLADQHCYYNSFKDKIQFADFSVTDYPRLEALDRAIGQAWKREPLRISASLQEEHIMGSRPALDNNGTRMLRGKVKFIKRYEFFVAM